jgi:hypothetical protein
MSTPVPLGWDRRRKLAPDRLFPLFLALPAQDTTRTMFMRYRWYLR